VDRDREDRPLIGPDVFVVGGRPGRERGAERGAGAATLEPVTIPAAYLEEERELFLEIVASTDRRGVTVLELLSPANKAKGDRHRYLAKREAVLHSSSNLVELDFLRAGRRVPLERQPPAADYHAMVYRAPRRPDCEVYSWRVRDRLPTLPLPLDPGLAEPLINYQAIFNQTYDRGRYALLLAYEEPPGPLADGDREWAIKTARAFRGRAG